MIYASNALGIQLLEYIPIEEESLSQFKSISSACVILHCQGKVLVGYNRYRKQWELPAGKVEKNETIFEAARRELFEETHQCVENLRFCGVFKIFDVNKNEIRYRSVFIGEIEALRLFVPEKNDEMLTIALWDTKKELDNMDLVDIKMLEMVEENLETKELSLCLKVKSK